MKKTAKSKPESNLTLRKVEEIATLLEERWGILNKINKSITKTEQHKRSVNNCKTINCIKVYDKKRDWSKIFVKWTIFC